MESILDKYNSLIDENPKKASVYLASMFGEMFEINITGVHYSIFAKLLKVYGIVRLKIALLDMYDMDNINLKNPYPLLVYFLKKRMETKPSDHSDSLMNYIEKQKKELGKVINVEKRTLDE